MTTSPRALRAYGLQPVDLLSALEDQERQHQQRQQQQQQQSRHARSTDNSRHAVNIWRPDSSYDDIDGVGSPAAGRGALLQVPLLHPVGVVGTIGGAADAIASSTRLPPSPPPHSRDLTAAAPPQQQHTGCSGGGSGSGSGSGAGGGGGGLSFGFGPMAAAAAVLRRLTPRLVIPRLTTIMPQLPNAATAPAAAAAVTAGTGRVNKPT